MYEQARPSVEMMGGVMPKWDMLSEEQKANIRIYNAEYKADLDNLVKDIKSGMG